MRAAADAAVVVSTVDVPSVMEAYAAIKLCCSDHPPAKVWTFFNQCPQPSQALEAHTRLSVACQRFLALPVHAGGSWEHVAPTDTPDDPPWSLMGRSPTAAASLTELARRLSQPHPSPEGSPTEKSTIEKSPFERSAAPLPAATALATATAVPADGHWVRR